MKHPRERPSWAFSEAVIPGVGHGHGKVEALLDEALQGQQGKRTDLVDNINEVDRPDGTSRQYVIRRLRREGAEGG